MCIEDSIAEYHYFRSQQNPSPGESSEALKKIAYHLDELRELLATPSDEAGGALKEIRKEAILMNLPEASNLLNTMRNLIEDLGDAVHQAQNHRRTPRKAETEQIILARRCRAALIEIDIKPSITAEDNKPESRYTRLLKWMLDKADTGGSNAVKIALQEKKLRDKTETSHQGKTGQTRS
jgi:hypothetical protein